MMNFRQLPLTHMTRLALMLAVSLWLAGGLLVVGAETPVRLTGTEIAGRPEQPAGGAPAGEFEARAETYVSRALGVSFALPDGFRVVQSPVDGDAELLLVERDARTGFQVFRAPYDEPELTPERIALDLPDLAVDRLREVDLAGVPALAFASSDPDLGPTHEVWFARAGFLYQVMTRAAFEDELQQILQTWRFLD